VTKTKKVIYLINPVEDISVVIENGEGPTWVF